MTEPRWILDAVVVAVHRLLVAQHGGSPGIRDKGLLDSALARPRQEWH
jgi:death on curing protein